MTLEEILLVFPTIVMVASAIVAATPTPKDDAVLAKVFAVLRVLALNVGNAKQDKDK